jgi:hypothetical protein
MIRWSKELLLCTIRKATTKPPMALTASTKGLTHSLITSRAHWCPALVGKDLVRIYEFSGEQLVLKSSSPNEHWRVAWDHY